ncbi:hypothetical protein SCANM63S_08448 [Streptomyces canarius]
MLDAHLPEGSYRVVEARDPERDRTAGGSAYSPAVGDWRSARAGIYERLIAEELDEDGTGTFLVWGTRVGQPCRPDRHRRGPHRSWKPLPGAVEALRGIARPGRVAR